MICPMAKILVSACLLGEKTKYDGGDNLVEELKGLLEFFELVPFCPEMEGGLPCPRVPAERKGNWVINKDGVDVTEQYREGAEKALRLCKLLGIELAILKQGSPSCGSKEIYDGYFRDRKIAGKGVTAALLSGNGVRVMDEEEAIAFLNKKVEWQKTHKEIVEKKLEAKAEKERKAAERKAKLEAKRSSFRGKKTGGKGYGSHGCSSHNGERKFSPRGRKPYGAKRPYKGKKESE